MTDTPMTPERDARQAVTRAIYALRNPPPDGSQHYQSGWDAGLDAAMETARDAIERHGDTLLAEVDRLRARVAELEARPSRAEVLREAADTADQMGHSPAITRELRRLTDESWHSAPCRVPDSPDCTCPEEGR